MNNLTLLLLIAILASSSAVSYNSAAFVHDEGLNWDELKNDGYEFVFAIASPTSSNPHPQLLADWEHFKQLGVATGALHVYESLKSPYENFLYVNKNIFEKVNFRKNDLFAVSFTENIGNRASDLLAVDYQTFLWLVEHKHEINPIIHTNQSFWDSAIGSAGNDYYFGSYRLWIDDYLSSDAPIISPTWQDFYIWSYKTGKFWNYLRVKE